MKALLNWLLFLPDKMARTDENVCFCHSPGKKTMTNDATTTYVVESAAFASYSALMQRQELSQTLLFICQMTDRLYTYAKLGEVL